ncbi:MAG TPA: MogA/MoaB family molybdenum cofactor biosynthesis protein [Terriglobales bacterium]
MPPKTTFSMADFRAAVVTVSDSCHNGERQDLSGPAVSKLLVAHKFQVTEYVIVPDQKQIICDHLIQLSENCDLIVTTGGTGIAPRDVTPEATREVCHRFIDGIPELMRAKGLEHTPYAVLSRALCGIRGQSIILNLPGSPKGAHESLESVIALISHALNLLRGDTAHPPDFHTRVNRP